MSWDSSGSLSEVSSVIVVCLAFRINAVEILLCSRVQILKLIFLWVFSFIWCLMFHLIPSSLYYSSCILIDLWQRMFSPPLADSERQKNHSFWLPLFSTIFFFLSIIILTTWTCKTMFKWTHDVFSGLAFTLMVV